MTENRPTHRVRQAEDRTLSMQKDRAERSGGWHGGPKSGSQNLESEVRAQEAKAEQADEGMQAARQEGMKLPLIFVGAFVYAFGMNYFLQPLHLYAGGMMGYAQLINTLLNMAGITFGGVKIYGILYYIMNVPAMILCYRRLRHRFVFKTVFAVTCITIFMQLIPIPAEPVLEDRLAECMIAGIICGAGIGVILRMGACDGGMNLFGMVIASEKQGAGGTAQQYRPVWILPLHLRYSDGDLFADLLRIQFCRLRQNSHAEYQFTDSGGDKAQGYEADGGECDGAPAPRHD